MIFREDLLQLVLAGSKTQTRRPCKYGLAGRSPDGLLPCRYVVGRSYAVQAARGGTAVARILIEAVERVTVYGISRDDARAEGFDRPDGFHATWAEMYGGVHGWCWKITFRLEAS